jgi:amino acid adenylation domain-containing protein/non-ribosomal peptide synthase protein (TIGR01720 family)
VLLLSRETVQDMPRLVELLTDYRPTVLNQTPQAFYALQGWLSATGQINLLPDLRYIIFGGDRLSVSALAPWLQARGYEAPALVNMYGITETTVHVTYHQLTAADLVNEDTGSPIGKPLPGMQVWVMDGDGQPLPVGFWGELWVSGTGVSEQGYHARAELTAARFVVHPDLGRLYRSGDVGQWTSHGLLRHRGRIDRQLKVRGHRLEAAEIEAVVLLQAGIRQAYAYVDEAGRLLLYYVGEASLAELQALAAEFLPPYAQPQHWIALDALPLTLNGKMDERRLPAPTTSTEASQPLSATEQPLAELWSALLGIPAAGLAPTANFFSLGGDSVQAIQLLSRLASQGHRVRLRDFLQTPTLQHLATLCSQSEPTQALASLPPEAIALRNRLQSQVAACYPDQAHHIEAVYELSPAQAGMLAGWLRYGDQGAYYEQMHYTLRSTLPPEVWQAAWQAVVAAHPMLRTHFVWEGVEEPAQVVWQAGSQPDGYTYTDLSQLDRAAQQDYLRNYRTQQAAQGIAADRAPLMRLSVFGLGQGRYAMEWTHSHLLMDGWCLQPLLQAFAQAAHRPTVALPSTPGYQTYLDYLWQVDKAAQQRYWQTYLRDLQAHTRLPAYRPTGQDYQAATISWRLDKATSAALQTLCQQWGIRSAVLWQGLWAGLLASYQGSNSQGQYEVLTGLLSAGRPSEVAEIETMIGLFVQALPLRVQAAGSDPVQAVMQALQASYIGWQAHQYSSVAAIQREATGLAAPLYNHVLIVENYPFDASNTDSPWTVETFEAQEQTHFDLNWVVYPPQQADEPFKGKVLFNQHVLDTQIVEAMIAQLQRLAEALLQAPTWQQWLQTASQFPEPASATTATTAATATLLPVRLQTVCQQQASQVAISWEDSPDALTYASLALLAGQIAQLVQAQVPPQTCVGICMPKQACLPALMWGVWQAGCYFVYLDPSLPSKRLQALVDQAQCGCLIGDPAAAALPILDWRTTPPPPPNFPPRVAAPHDCAYLIMTSGSTGVPKAVAISHANVANLIAWAVPQYAPFAVQTVLSGTSPAFDLSIFEYFYALCAGKHLKMLRDNLQIERFLHLPDLLINTVPSVLKALVKADLSRVTVVNTAGEPIQRDTVAALLAFPQLHCFNLYAPSETTTYSTCHAFARDEQGPVSIGKPLLNTEILILDEALNPLPAFASGEIWIGGQGVAQGYLGDEAQTQAKFRTLPDRQGRWYRTGDFAYKLPSGALVFEGRKDNLLKIRGFRIELEEINHWLRQQPAVRDAFSVVYLEKIYAFVCTDADNWQPVQCLEALSATLPAYMLPFQLLRVEALPTNANGKIDAKALLAQLAEIAPNIATAPREATTPAEQILVRLCQQLLSQPNLHLGDNFFALGGDSIVAMQLVGQLKTQGWDCAYAQVFAAADLGALADALTPLTKATPVVQPLRAHRLEANPLSPIQQWFLARFQGNINHFNQSVLLSTQLPLDLDTLREAVAQVLADHPILRTPFDPHTRTYWAIQPVETVLAQLHGHTWAAFDEPTWETLANQAQSSLSLPEGRLWAMEIVQTPQRTYWLWVIHHWVVDGVSWRILLDSLLQNYQQIQQGQRQQPGIPTLAFADWLGYLDNHCQQTWESEQAYWAELQPSIRQTSGLIAVASDTYADTQVSTMSLDAETTRRLLFEAPKHYQAEVNHLLLSALWRAWWQLTQQKTLAICLEGHGREPIHPEAEVFHTVGWFTSLFPVALQSEATTWEQLVQAIGQQLQQIPQKGLAYLQAHLKQPDLFALPSICFNYLGQYDTMQQSTLFRWETLPQGAAVDPAATRLFAIEINAWVVGQCLHIQMSAGHSLQNLHIAAWANAFVQQLTDLVQAAGGLAQQALPAKETTAYLSTEELRNIEDLIEGLE